MMEQSNNQLVNGWTSGLERLWLAWEASDPSWLRLTQSLKTVLAVVLTMGIVYPLASGDMFVSAIGAGFYAVARGPFDQQLTLIQVSVMVLAALGAAFDSTAKPKKCLIVGVAFLTLSPFRFRRPGLAYAFVVCLLATVLPGGRECTMMPKYLCGSGRGLSFFYIRPPNPGGPPRACVLSVRASRIFFAALNLRGKAAAVSTVVHSAVQPGT